MPRQTGLIMIEGRIGNLSFYKTKDGYLVRTKGEGNPQRSVFGKTITRKRQAGEDLVEDLC
ncbi:MAG: hypothetical protein AB2L24_10070 [Mangrovibacterium sp.]